MCMPFTEASTSDITVKPSQMIKPLLTVNSHNLIFKSLEISINHQGMVLHQFPVLYGFHLKTTCMVILAY